MLIGSGSKRSPPQANSNRWISVKFAPLVTPFERAARQEERQAPPVAFNRWPGAYFRAAIPCYCAVGGAIPVIGQKLRQGTVPGNRFLLINCIHEPASLFSAREWKSVEPKIEMPAAIK